ncbi:MATE family efflux transporter [Paraclostridium tenue]|uniref:Probable multidrug resistance protein NorM n=1 Tax=Paraclostridium tenue TaxID=1737 RepID=A0ABN1M475_9FIRM
MKINKLAIPLMLNNITSMVITLCDQAMIGRTYMEGFASVGIIGNNIYEITGVLGAISIGLNIVGSRAKGKNDIENLNNSLCSNLLNSLIIGVIFTTLSLIFGKSILQNIFNLKDNTLIDSIKYLNIFSLSLGINLIIFNLSSYFKIIKETKFILYGGIISCTSNVLFDYVLIFGKLGFPSLGIKGNAIGSVLSLILCIIYYLIVIKKFKLIKKTNIKLFKNTKEIFSISIPIMLQEFIESTLLVFVMTYILAQIGLLEVAVYNLLFSIINIALMPMYAYGQVALNLVSEEFGANNISKIQTIINSCIKRPMYIYIIFCSIIIIFKSYIPKILTNDYEVISMSSKYMFILVIANFMNIPKTILTYSLQSLNKEKLVFAYSSIISIISMVLIYLLVKLTNLKLNSIYLGNMLCYAILILFLYKEFIKFKYHK